MKRPYLLLTVIVVAILLGIASRLPVRVKMAHNHSPVVKVIDVTPPLGWVEMPRHPTRFHKLSDGVWQTHDGEPLPPETIKVLSAVFDDDFRFDVPEQPAP